MEIIECNRKQSTEYSCEKVNGARKRGGASARGMAGLFNRIYRYRKPDFIVATLLLTFIYSHFCTKMAKKAAYVFATIMAGTAVS